MRNALLHDPPTTTERRVGTAGIDPPARAVVKLGVEIPDVLASIMMTVHADG